MKDGFTVVGSECFEGVETKETVLTAFDGRRGAGLENVYDFSRL